MSLSKEIQNLIDKDRDSITKMVSDLIKSQNTNDLEDTQNAMLIIKNFLDEHHISYENCDFLPKMPNIITCIENAKGKHLMFNGHLDVLPAGNEPNWEAEPFSGIIKNGKIWGRGAADMKAGVVAMLFAFKYVNHLKSNINGKLSLSIVSDEETGWGRGTGYMFRKIPEKMMADAVLLAEPSHKETIIFSSKGYTQFDVEVQTSGAIAGYEFYSKNAIIILSEIITELRKLEDIKIELPKEISHLLEDENWIKWYEKRVGKITHLLPKISVNIGTIEGGDASYIIPSKAKMEVILVTPQNVDRQKILAKARRIVSKFTEAKMKVIGGDDAEMSPTKSEIVETLQNVVQNENGFTPQPVPEIAISDARYWRYKGIPAYWYGLNGETVAMANEHIDIEELLNLTKIYTLTALIYLK